jgi:hypothetical protein
MIRQWFAGWPLAGERRHGRPRGPRTLAADQDHRRFRSAQLPDIDIPADSRFFGKPLEANEMIAEMQNMIGHA